MKKSKSERAFSIVNTILLLIFALLIILPIIHVVSASFSDPAWVRSYKGLILFPKRFNVRGYSMVFANHGIYRSIFNSIFYMVVGTGINLIMTILGSYVLSRKGVLLNKILMMSVTITMFFSGGIIPLYILLNKMELLNTPWAILLPVAISPWNMIILRTAFQGVPDEIVQAARIDGAGDVRLMMQISVPLVKATLAIIALYYAVGHWNSWFSAMAFLGGKRELYPLQLIIRELLIINDTSEIVPGGMNNIDTLNYGTLIKYCTVVISIVPMIVLFPFVQKYFTKGVLLGSIK